MFGLPEILLALDLFEFEDPRDAEESCRHLDGL